jgi:deoxyadenosine/deoxycytidine kinase/DNA-binding XRE family transcriptional regulator/nucleoside 2-deoxyribosyltransferase
MNRSVIELGHLIRSFRKDRELTQHELAQAVAASRSAIALMEQGRRLLNTDALRSVSQYLGIPESMVTPFMSPALQSRRNKVASEPASFVPFQVLCVSGISGSGKTTLAEVIARTFGIERIGSHPTGRAYLKDLESNQDRWAFEAQVAFLVSKTSQIRQKLDQEEPVVVERWIDEDILVYERLFEEAGAIDPRSHDTFQQVVNLAHDILPLPEYHFYCECSVETALNRVNARGRSDSKLHSREYISRSKQLYDEWRNNLHGPELYIINTDNSDLKKPGVIDEVFREIEWILTHDLRDPQISLFESGPITSNGHLQHISPVRPDRWMPISKIRRKTITAATPLVAPVAYLAAPFSGRDIIQTEQVTQSSLFEMAPGHGVIPRSGFRQDLLGIERALRTLGLSVLLPHRDVNEWGRKQLTPNEAMRECTHHVATSDLFVGILGNSCGAHYEFGIASASGKPCILIEVEEISSSFLSSGVSVLKSHDLMHLSCKRLKDAADLLSNSKDVKQFIERHLGRGVSFP